MPFPQPGESFHDGTYELHEVLGEGGFAVVFRATERGSAGREVAVKILKPGDGGYAPDTVARYDREVRALSQLRDPHSVTLFAYGTTTAGLRFLVFEYVPGRDLAALIAEVGKLEPTAVIHVTRQILEALREAHALGLLHRDIKPDNVRVFTYMGDPLRVKLIDFGIAKAARPDGFDVTRQGELVGTLRYMSPEQLTDGVLGPASDLYSVGMVAFEMLQGTDALHGKGLGDQFDRLADGHVFATDSGDTSALDIVIARMCAREPAARYQNASQALEALASIGARPIARPPSAPALPVSAAPSPTVSAPPVRRSGSAPTWLGYAVGALVAAALAILVGLYAQRGEEVAPSPPAPQRDLSMIVRAPAPANPLANTPSPTDDAATLDPVDAAPTAEPRQGGCGQDPPFVGTSSLSMSTPSGLTKYHWTVTVPAGYKPDVKHPVIVVFHQALRSGKEIIAQTGFDELADEAGVVVIAPDGGNVAWRSAADLELVPTIMATTFDTLCLDPGRIFVVGHGVGGYAASLLSCRPWAAGIATNAFRLNSTDFSCEPADAVPHLHYAAMDSTRVRLDNKPGCGGMRKIALSKWEKIWRQRNKCTGSPRETDKDNGHVCLSWECEKPFVSCHLRGGHTWPGSDLPETDILGCDPREGIDFPGTAKLWAFFSSLEPTGDEIPTAW